MKVVIVALRYFGSGGAENVIHKLTSEIAKAKDIELSILTDNKYKGEIESWMNNVRTFNFFDLPILSFEFIQRLLPLKRIIDEIKPDLVHMHGCVVPIPKNVPSLDG